MRSIAALLLMVGMLSFNGPVVNAGPAPNLSQIRITHVGADITGWKTVAEAKNLTLYGQYFYLAATFMGYPEQDSIKVYSNGSLVPDSELSMPFGVKPIGNPITGYLYQWKMPLKYGKGILSVEARGLRGGKKFNTISGIHSEYRE